MYSFLSSYRQPWYASPLAVTFELRSDLPSVRLSSFYSPANLTHNMFDLKLDSLCTITR